MGTNSATSWEGSNTSEGSNWLDVEPDMENIEIVSLFDDVTFSTLSAMLDYCKKKYRFDLLDNIQRLRLDFLGAVRLTNFIRTQVRDKSTLPKQISREDIEDERYLSPVLNNDAVLFSLDEILGVMSQDEETPANKAKAPIDELLDRNKTLEAELYTIHERFTNYRLAVEQTLDRRWGVDEVLHSPLIPRPKEASNSYFESYAANGTEPQNSKTLAIED
ncbi:hypothetical protein E4U17_000692 [Claviceps sp. LM77 group G4]|nr:hypothetical protein E4U17_000692 [Claviceps sp. LM77 group G4]KAG6052102.1 hypothetical protein E4U33_000568 [Claviceps sp. LM78 group G4]KAG6067181.1 hypothetical protein E4U16_000118 [Claviceps sp. LM84 group G4]